MSLHPSLVMAIPCKQILLAKYSSEEVSDDSFEVCDGEAVTDAIESGSGDVLVKNLLLSVDPWNRLCMHSTNQGLYFPPFTIGKPIPVLSVSKVISSDNADLKAGDLVTGLAAASEYSLMRGGKDGAGFPLTKIDSISVPLENHLTFLGLPGFTAWIGIVRIGEAKAGDQVFVSAASGGVGLAAGQIAKARGCRVVGSASTDEKVRLLKECGFDDAFNYKKEVDWNAALARFFPNGIDIYFDNVGGKMLEAALNHINQHARIPISGMISQYNKDWKLADGVRNLMNLVGKCAKMEGFLGYDIEHYDAFVSEMLPLVAQENIASKHTITKGIENYPSAFIGMMRGENFGKALVHVADP